MIKLKMNGTGEASIIRSYNSYKGVSFVDMSEFIRLNINNGTNILVKTDNVRPKKHSGTYYLMYQDEYSIVYLFYLDSSNIFRVIATASKESAVDLIYRNVADETKIVILRSSNIQAYRVCCENNYETYFVRKEYKNKDSQVISQSYMSLFDAINTAVHNYKSGNPGSYKVVTKRGKVIFSIG